MCVSRTIALVALAALAAFAAVSLAGEQVVIDLTGVKFKNAVNQSRSSAPNKIDPALGYRYLVDGMVKGDSGLLALLYPSPTPLADVLEALLPGSSEALNGELYNPQNAHPFGLVNQRYEGEGDFGGIHVSAGVTLTVQIQADDVAGFAMTDVVLQPSYLVGSMSFTTGAATLTRIPAVTADMNWDGSVNAFDIQPFVMALGDPALYTSTYGYSPLYAGDVNRDGSVNSFDIEGFVDALSNP